MYAYKLEKYIIEKEFLNEKITIQTQTFHAYETVLIQKYKNQN